MPINKDSNVYVFGFLFALILVVSVVLSVVSVGLKSSKDKNIALDKKKKILRSVIIKNDKEIKTLFTPDFVQTQYGNKIKELVVDANGKQIPEEKAFDIDFAKEMKKDAADRKYPVYIYEDKGDKTFIFPVLGLGLWDEISGYMALESDFNTIKGAAFDHKGETPGLGAKLAEYPFMSQFSGKQVFDNQGNYVFDILKGEGNKLGPYTVDGMSGATLTTDGVEAMIKCGITDCYKGFIENQKNK